MKLVTVDCKYIDYLRNFCETIQHNKNGARPYIGVLIKIGEHSYYAPFSSPKDKHIKMKNSIDFIKVDNGNLGVININNMIPLCPSSIKSFFIEDIKDKKYRKLLEEQFLWISNNKANIQLKAEKLYVVITTKENTVFHSRCNNFKLLEEKSLEYLKEKEIDPWEKQLKGFKNTEKEIDLK